MPRVGGDTFGSAASVPAASPHLESVHDHGRPARRAYFAKFFSVFALGPALVAGAAWPHNNTLISWGTNFETNHAWMIGARCSWSRCRPYPDRRDEVDISAGRTARS